MILKLCIIFLYNIHVKISMRIEPILLLRKIGQFCLPTKIKIYLKRFLQDYVTQPKLKYTLTLLN